MSVRREQAKDLAKLTAFMVIAALITVWLAAVTGDVQSGDRSDYRARFANVSGLGAGDQVRVAGVTVGKVTKVKVQPDATVLVSFNLRTELQINEATTATVRYRNLIGDRLLELGRADAQAKPLRPGAEIALARTASAVDLDTLLSGFKPLFAGLNPQQINELSGQLVEVLQGQTSAVEHLVSTVGSFTSTLADRSDLVTQVVTNLNSVLGVVESRKDTFADLITELSTLVDGLDRQDTQLLNAAAQVDGFARSAAGLLGRARDDLTPTLTGLADSARALNSKAGTLETVLNKLPDHYPRILATASYGNFFNFFLCGVRVKLTDVGGTSVQTPYILSDLPRCRR